MLTGDSDASDANSSTVERTANRAQRQQQRAAAREAAHSSQASGSVEGASSANVPAPTNADEIAELERLQATIAERLLVARAAKGITSTTAGPSPLGPSGVPSARISEAVPAPALLPSISSAPIARAALAPASAAAQMSSGNEARVPPGGAPVVPMQLPRAREPSTFDGRVVDRNVFEWLRDIRAIADVCFPVGAQEQAIVMWAGSYMTKDAQAWWQQPAVRQVCSTWTLFEASVRARFAPVEQAQSARVRLAALRQGNGPDSLSAYIARFQAELEFAPDMAEADRMHRFGEGLRLSLMREVLRVQPATTTLAQMMERAIAAEAIEAMLVRHGAPVQRRGGAGSVAPSSIAPGGASSLAAAETDDTEEATPTDAGNARIARLEEQLAAFSAALQANRSGRGRGGRGRSGPGRSGSGRGEGMSNEERRRHFDQGLCFRCHRSGHQAAACPERKAASGDREGWQGNE